MNFKQMRDGTFNPGISFFLPGSDGSCAMGTGSKGSSTRECTKSGEGKFGDKEQPSPLIQPTSPCRLGQKAAEKGGMWVHSVY